jgi:hypothetical protein
VSWRDVSDEVLAGGLEPARGERDQEGRPALDRPSRRGLGPPRPLHGVHASLGEEPGGEGRYDDVEREAASRDLPHGAVVPRAPGGDVQPSLLDEEDLDEPAVVQDVSAPTGGAVSVPAGSGTNVGVAKREHAAS